MRTSARTFVQLRTVCRDLLPSTYSNFVSFEVLPWRLSQRVMVRNGRSNPQYTRYIGIRYSEKPATTIMVTVRWTSCLVKLTNAVIILMPMVDIQWRELSVRVIGCPRRVQQSATVNGLDPLCCLRQQQQRMDVESATDLVNRLARAPHCMLDNIKLQMLIGLSYVGSLF